MSFQENTLCCAISLLHLLKIEEPFGMYKSHSHFDVSSIKHVMI